MQFRQQTDSPVVRLYEDDITVYLVIYKQHPGYGFYEITKRVHCDWQRMGRIWIWW